MNSFFSLIWIAFLSSSAFGGIEPPKGFFEYQNVSGDLNKDKRSDAVIIWTSCERSECDSKDEGVKIITQVYLRGKKDLKLISSSDGVVCFRCGGAKGDRIVGNASINKNGILEFDYFGGSRWTWGHKLKWRLDANSKLILIGSSFDAVDTIQEPGQYAQDSVGEMISSDVNYSTKKAEIKVIGKNLKPEVVKCRLDGDFKIPEFAVFKFEDFSDGTQSCRKKR